MNEDRIKGQWKQLAGKIKERYGIAHDEARKQVKKVSRLAVRLMLLASTKYINTGVFRATCCFVYLAQTITQVML